MDYAVSAEHLSLSLGGRDILRDVTLSIETGSITAVVGPNGCGKSTLLKTMSRMLRPDKGTITIFGRDITSFSRRELARHIAVLPQLHQAPDDMTVRELARMGRFPYRTFYRPASPKDELYVEKALHAVRLEDKADAVVQQLSGGEQQRVWLAMLLAQRSSILYLDEPTTYLDMRHQLHMMRLLNHVNEKLGLTIVVVLHDMNQALQYTQQAIVMKDGEIVCTGRTADVLTPDLMRRVFGVQAELVQMSDGRRALIPLGLER